MHFGKYIGSTKKYEYNIILQCIIETKGSPLQSGAPATVEADLRRDTGTTAGELDTRCNVQNAHRLFIRLSKTHSGAIEWGLRCIC